jgi:nitrogen fixation protein FixH
MKTKFNPWPYGIFVFFGLLFCGMAAIVTIAATHRESMVSENYYEQELKFQDQIDAAARAQKSGATIVADAASGNVVITMPAAQLAQKFSGTIGFYRPSEPKLDQSLPLTPRADGTQTLDVSKLAAGLWQVHVKWNAGGENYFLEQKVTVAGK